MDEIVKKFKALFGGSSLAHGTYDKSTGRMATISSPATELDYEKHLNGELGLGIIPVDENGKCWFGAIDIDVDTIDHKDLYKKIKDRNMPLTVCRSKSGGAHLYVFFKEQQAASTVQNLLRKWASLLGYPSDTEIFPKQTKSIPDNKGSWINLPYFSSHSTMRYAINSNGSIGADEFVTSIVFYNGHQQVNEKVTSDLIQIDLMPPCLRILTEEGLPEGHRNNGLFNFSVFYRKSSPNGWEEKIRSHNKNYVKNPLPTYEVEALIKSVSARQYQYKCNEEPICSRCDRKTCLTLQYGVGYKPWEDGESFDDPVFQNLRKMDTKPPTYILEVDSIDIHLDLDEFMVYEKFKRKMFEENYVLRPLKQSQWALKTKQLLSSRVDIKAPIDASLKGAILTKVDEFLSKHDKYQNSREDLARDNPILENGKVKFTIEGLQKYLHGQRVKIENSSLFQLLIGHRCDFETMTIKGKRFNILYIDLELVNRQTEPFTPAKFEREEPEI